MCVWGGGEAVFHIWDKKILKINSNLGNVIYFVDIGGKKEGGGGKNVTVMKY